MPFPTKRFRVGDLELIERRSTIGRVEEKVDAQTCCPCIEAIVVEECEVYNENGACRRGKCGMYPRVA